MELAFWIARHSGPHCVGPGVTVRTLRTLFFQYDKITYVQNAYVILSYVNRTFDLII